MPLDAPEAFGGAQQAEPEPPPTHVAVAPPLDVRDISALGFPILNRLLLTLKGRLSH
jgi:hypothetical protein